MSNLTTKNDYYTGGGNRTLLSNPYLCTIKTCDLTLSNFLYIPSLPGNAAVAALFGACLVAQIGLGIKYKTWGYMSVMMLGLILEMIGYAARIMMHNNPFDGNAFLMYLVVCTIAPALLTAAIYLCLARIVNAYGDHLSYFKPRTYTLIFCTVDFICLLLQAIGGAIASTSNTSADTELGRKIMIAGLLFQVFGIFAFLVAGGSFAFAVIRSRGNWNQKYISITTSLLFKSFIGGLFIATITIMIRCIYRCTELWGGFNGELFLNHQGIYMVFEATMILIASLCLTIFHPGVCFQGTWHDANFYFRLKKMRVVRTKESSDEEATSVAMRGLQERK